MKRRKSKLLRVLLVVFVVAIVFVYGWYKNKTDRENRSANLASQEEKLKEVKSLSPMTVKENTRLYSIDVSLERTGVSWVDAQIAVAVEESIDSFKEYIVPQEVTEIQTVTLNPEFKYTLSGKGKVSFINNEYVAYRYDTYEDTGGAHGIPNVMTFVFDLQNNKELVLSDFFVKGSSYLSHVSRLIRPKLNTQICGVMSEGDPDYKCPKDPTEEIILGTSPTEDNFRNFLISDTGITFIFTAYQVGPYVIGQPEVELSFFELQSIKN